MKTINKKFNVVQFNGTDEDLRKFAYNVIEKWRKNDKDSEIKEIQKNIYVVPNHRKVVTWTPYNSGWHELCCTAFYWYRNKWNIPELETYEKNQIKVLVNLF